MRIFLGENILSQSAAKISKAIGMHRRKKCTDKYFKLVFKDIKFTSLYAYPTRLKKSRLDIQKNAFSCVGAKMWNKMQIA